MSQGEARREVFHPDLVSGSREIGMSGATDVSFAAGLSKPDYALYSSATNLDGTALDLIRPIVLGENALLVASAEDLLSILSMAMELRPGLTFADRAALKILLTGLPRPQSRVAVTAHLDQARLLSYYLRPNGVRLPDPRDLGAISARDAVAAGSIQVRVVNPDRLAACGQRVPCGIRANIAVGEDFAALSSGGFSRQDLVDRAILIDRVASDGAAYAARRRSAEVLWAGSDPCNIETLKILDALVRPADLRTAMATAVDTLGGYDPFRSMDGSSRVRSDLVGQALARVYEHGFAFVPVPAGAGLPEIQDEIGRGLDVNATRMIGGGGMTGLWAVHVETETGSRWSADRIEATLAERAPLALDGTISTSGEEGPAEAAFRRMVCRRAGPRSGEQGEEEFPEIVRDVIHVAVTKAQSASYAAALSEIDAAISGALDRESEESLLHLKDLLHQSPEAALLAWKQGGMSDRTRSSSISTSNSGGISQNVLPIFAGSAEDHIPESDPVGDALSARSLRATDRSRVKAIQQIHADQGQVLCLVEDDLVRHVLARKMTELCDGPVVAVVGEAQMRAAGVGSRDAAYQRAETGEIAMSMLAGAGDGPIIVFAASEAASGMSLPQSSAAVVLSNS